MAKPSVEREREFFVMSCRTKVIQQRLVGQCSRMEGTGGLIFMGRVFIRTHSGHRADSPCGMCWFHLVIHQSRWRTHRSQWRRRLLIAAARSYRSGDGRRSSANSGRRKYTSWLVREVYRDQCAACHGFHGKPSSFGGHMFPSAPQLWEKHRNTSVVGVSDDPPGETYWRGGNGLRLTGMPSYDKILTETEMWQVTRAACECRQATAPAAWIF